MHEMVQYFKLEGTPVCSVRFGSGHINETVLVVTNQPHLYVLQNVNTKIFPNARGLMSNVIKVTDFLRSIDPDPRHVLTLVPTLDGAPYILTEDNQLWRVYEYITGGVCLEQAETPEDFRQSAVAFGMFQRQLSEFPAEELVETIPRFHDTPNRFRNLHRAMETDPVGRLKEIGPELAFLLEREESAGFLLNLLKEKKIPLRVTHNDTKLNNVMLDEKTRLPMCIMDLDTVMPGLAAYDFGDSIRFGASTALEDEKDLSKVSLSLPLYRTYVDGFLSACGENLWPAEIETLPEGARLMTMENAVRFLTDYLEGDTYYHIDRPEHNLDRCRTQIRLVQDMEDHWQEMKQAVRG